MAAAAIPVMIAGTAISGYGQYQAGRAAARIGQQQQQASEYEAAQMRQQAGQDIAAAQRTSADTARETTLLASRALAVAGASGAGVTDPTVVNVLSNISGEGAYRQSLDVYAGEEKARRLNMAADARSYEGELQAQSGKYKQQAYNISALGDILRSGGTMFAKYGGTPPPSTPETTTTTGYH